MTHPREKEHILFIQTNFSRKVKNMRDSSEEILLIPLNNLNRVIILIKQKYFAGHIDSYWLELRGIPRSTVIVLLKCQQQHRKISGENFCLQKRF